jgi:hypothetical protein
MSLVTALIALDARQDCAKSAKDFYNIRLSRYIRLFKNFILVQACVDGILAGTAETCAESAEYCARASSEPVFVSAVSAPVSAVPARIKRLFGFATHCRIRLSSPALSDISRARGCPPVVNLITFFIGAPGRY